MASTIVTIELGNSYQEKTCKVSLRDVCGSL